jgi:hypothetical protein
MLSLLVHRTRGRPLRLLVQPLGRPGSDQSAHAHSFNTMTLQLPPQQEWYFDSGATSHMTSDVGTLIAPLPGSLFPPQLLSVTAPFSLLPQLVRPPFLGPFILIMFLFPRTLLRILLPFTSLYLTTIALWNLTHLVALSRIFSLGTRSSGTISLASLPVASTSGALHTTTSASMWHRRLGLLVKL